jgi:serine/threonine-protein kinase
MSPEQAEGQPPKPTDDLFSLGLVLGEMLSGSPLRDGGPSAAASRPPSLPSDLPAAFDDLRVIVARMIAPEPAARFKVAAEVERAFSTVLAAATLRGETSPVAELARLVAAAAPVAAGATEPISAAPPTMAPPTVDEPSLPARRPALAFFPHRGAWAIAGLLVVTVLGGLVFRGARTAPVVVEPPAAIPRLSAPVAPEVATPRQETPATTMADAPAARAPIVAAPRPRGETGRPLARLRITAPGSWVAVYLDGKKLGDDAGSFAIPAGRHLLRVENPPLGFVSSEIINIRPGEEVGRTYAPAP